MGESFDCEIPADVGWRVRGDHIFPDTRSPYIWIPLRQLLCLGGFLIRFLKYRRQKYQEDKRPPFIDSLSPRLQQPIYGVSCGTLGSGSIGRSFRGGFCRFGLRPGLIEEGVPDPANGFSVAIRRPDRGSVAYAQSLFADAPVASSRLSSWTFSFPAANIRYVGLYPQSWTEYVIPGWRIRLICRQMSPVIPGDYQTSCYPVSAFQWHIENNESVDLEISLLFSFQSGGTEASGLEPCETQAFSNQSTYGVVLKHSIGGMPYAYGLGLDTRSPGVAASVHTGFDPYGSGKEIWDLFRNTGKLEHPAVAAGKGSSKPVAVAICAQVLVKTGAKAETTMSLCWPMPRIKFGKGRRWYSRRYTNWFKGNLVESAVQLCTEAVEKGEEWTKQIMDWQRPILDSSQLPAWYKSAVFNELYFLSDGGSVWVNFCDSWLESEPSISPYTADCMRKWGRFAYLESWEYRLFTTYDVHFFASFALAMLWPEIQHTIQADYRDQVFREDLEQRQAMLDGENGVVKTKYSIPHDLGDPWDDPWLHINAYCMHNTSEWRDLNCQFILSSYRDYLILGKNQQFLQHVWPAIQALIDFSMAHFDTDLDGMIENSNRCDQTYDVWIMSGTSAYCGGLWLGALKIATEIAGLCGEEAKKAELEACLVRAKTAYEKKLWTGSYYKFDEHSKHHDSLMANQLCGYWYASAVGLGKDLLPKDHVLKALRSVYEKNVCSLAGGTMGAINGVRPNGIPDRVSMQALEVWTGVTYVVAAHMIAEGMVDEGFRTASGVYNSCFGPLGLQFQTPEAYYEKRWFRACGYMRPLSIWAIQWALKSQQNEESS